MTKLYVQAVTRLQSLRNGKDDGATMVEYGLIVAVIALVVVAGATIFGEELGNFFEGLGGDLAEKTP